VIVGEWERSSHERRFFPSMYEVRSDYTAIQSQSCTFGCIFESPKDVAIWAKM
jgi:hypothetical protein